MDIPVEKIIGVFNFDKAFNKKKLEISEEGSLIKSTPSLVKFSKLFSSNTDAANFILIFLQNFSKIFIFLKER